MRLRQEVVNVVLAECLQEAGLAAVPEQIIRAAASGNVRLPDVIVDFEGLRLAIEGEVATTPDAEAKAVTKAMGRVEEGLAHVGIGIVYPAEAASWSFEQLRGRLPTARLRFAVATDLPDTPSVSEGSVADVGDALRRAYEGLVEDQALQRALAILEVAIDRWVWAQHRKRGNIARCAQVLGMRQVREAHAPVGQIALTAEQQQAVNRVTGLVLANAMIFHQILSEAEDRVESLASTLSAEMPSSGFLEHWDFILKEINYYPIFHVARELLATCGSSFEQEAAVKALAEGAKQIVAWRAALRHDLMGRVYHRLLQEAKYLGAYYTSVPAAVLLLKLALGGQDPEVDWSDPDAVGLLRLADLACGTGTLLMAAADVIVDNHVRACAATHQRTRVDQLQRVLLAHTLWGYDVLPSALHLTASTLALRIPEVPVDVTNLYAMPLGGPDHRLGSLEFLRSRSVPVIAGLFGATTASERVVRKDAQRVKEAGLPDLDVCVMNPPFTRSVGGNLLFGNFPQGERAAMQRRLQEAVRGAITHVGGGTRGLSASITAGLGSVFVGLADRRLKPGGTLALVLPQGLLSGIAWAKTRDLIGTGYHLDYIVVSHEPDRWNFSENTNLSECLTVARRAASNDTGEHSVVCANLWRNARSPIEALAIARQLRESQAPDALTGQGALQLRLGATKVGEAVAVPQSLLQRGLWQFGCTFAQAELVRAFLHMLQGRLHLPGLGVCGEVPLAPLSGFAAVGPDRRDVHDGFEESRGETPFPAFWGHDSERVLSLNQLPNRHLSPLPKAKPGRNLRRATDLWPRAGRLLIAERLRTNTDRLAAVYLPLPVLSNVWWPTRVNHRGEEAEKPMALWLNSTLGLIMSLGHRGETCGAWCQLKKPIVEAMPVLDLDRLKPKQRRVLLDCFAEVGDSTLQPFPGMEDDPVRGAIDGALSRALGLPNIASLRAMLAREPVVTLDAERLTRHPYPDA